MALHHLTRPKHRSLSKPSLIHLFSTTPQDPSLPNSTTTTTTATDDSNQQQQKSSFSSYFSDVKASLKQQSQQPQNNPSFQKPPTYSSMPKPNTTNKISSLDEIRKNLSEFRRRSAVPNPTPPRESASQQHVSFQELYKRNVIAKSNGVESSTAGSSGYMKGGAGGGGGGRGGGGMLPFERIKESLRKMQETSAQNSETRGSMSLSVYKNSLKLKPENPGLGSTVIGGTKELPMSVFGKELMKGEEGGGKRNEAENKTELIRLYTYGELGNKLRELRPEEAKKEGEEREGEWFSLEELNERLAKLRKMEEEYEFRSGSVPFKDLRDSLVKLKLSDDEKAKKNSIQRLDILNQLGGTPDFMLHPPKEHLVEKYFHPDNMSSAEKMKLQLKKVREEFKMSESDCGSARVQVAQLTTKINHLATALHKKDTHSRKGLVAMVHKRKKLLKYLRRTDWDSYCLVLFKLSLRDNPDYKH